MVVGFITTYAISVFHNKHEFETSSGDVHSRQHYVNKFVSDLWQIGGTNMAPVSVSYMIYLHNDNFICTFFHIPFLCVLQVASRLVFTVFPCILILFGIIGKLAACESWYVVSFSYF
jgi:hypothetical protein